MGESILVPTILCGGAGSRLWPVSRQLHPKPFIRLADGRSLLQKAFWRGASLPGVSDVLTVTNREFFFKTEGEYREVEGDLAEPVAQHYVLEPFGRNTAAAIACSTLWAQGRYGDDAQLLVLAADHLITDQVAFEDAVGRARELAAGGRIVTFGIRPDKPETGYGYIEMDGHSVRAFVEKPDLERAEAYLRGGKHAWNSGMFCFSVGAMLAELEKHAPDMLDFARRSMDAGRYAEGQGFSQWELDADSFAPMPDQSIDYAVMEKTDNAAVVPCEIGWSDIGSWNALGELADADSAGNRVEGEAILHNSNNCYVRSEERLVGAVGVDDLIIVDTPDALLVAGSDHAQEVKQLFAQLKREDHEAHRLHRTVHRPWGTYTVLEEDTHFKIKRLVVQPGASLSLQLHHHRSEHWVVVSGTARVINDGEESLLTTNESTFISAGHRHRVENPGVVELVMIEVQTGEYLGEDDIVRFADEYGRN